MRARASSRSIGTVDAIRPERASASAAGNEPASTASTPDTPSSLASCRAADTYAGEPCRGRSALKPSYVTTCAASSRPLYGSLFGSSRWQTPSGATNAVVGPPANGLGPVSYGTSWPLA